MANVQGKQQFEAEVFAAELQEIRRRRHNAADERALPPDPTPPDASLGLVGLAFSGGGIRSASFSMGVLQRLIETGFLRKVDYLSTVSGGGYTGSCLSALMHEKPGGEQLLVKRVGEQEPPALNHVRNRSNYLLPRGLFNQLRLPALFIAGAFRTLLMMLPPIVLLVLLTDLFFELTSYLLIENLEWIAALGVLPLVVALVLGPMRKGRASWRARDRASRRLGGWLLLAGASLLAVPALKGLAFAVNNDAAWVFSGLAVFLTGQLAMGLHSPLLWSAAVAAALLVLGAVRLREKLLLVLVGMLGPLLLLAIYVVACIQVVNTPISIDDDFSLRRAIDTFRSASAPGDGPDVLAASPAARAVEAEVSALLSTKQIELGDYTIAWQGLRDNDRLVLQRKAELPLWTTVLTQHGSPQLHINFVSDPFSAPGSSESAHRHVQIEELRLLKGHAAWWFYLCGLGLWLYNLGFLNLNRISMHPFYRDRLSRTFLVKPRGGDGPPQLDPADDLRMSQTGGERSAAPYHLVNTALNLQGSQDPQLRERKTIPFVLAKRHCGSDFTGYCTTPELEAVDPHFDLGTAMAISAAAASPNMGAVSVRPLTFLLAMLNVRLNYWLPHPQRAARRSWVHRLLYRRLGLMYLLSEALGTVDEHTPYINCSDGGHIENLAVYELLRRRCATIVCVDGEEDAGFNFGGLVTLQRYAQIDLGASIVINLDGLRATGGVSQRQHALGTITYADGSQGSFIYLKLSYSGAEPEYLRFYQHAHPQFPHEPTADQFFEETQFEVYRALGYHVATGMLADPAIHQLT